MNLINGFLIGAGTAVIATSLFIDDLKHKKKDTEISLICVNKNEYLVYEKGDNIAVSFTFKNCEVEDD